MTLDLEKVYDELYSYCKTRDFAGHDPFDALNSRLFRALPLKYIAPARLAWLQMVKRSAADLRPFLRVEKGVNPKGLALFALAELSRFSAGGDDANAENARELLNRLLEHGIYGTFHDRPTLAFGYNFDWQSRAFFAPVGTPAIVPTAFASQALIEGYRVFEDERYLTAAGEICEFILSGLNRAVETDEEICFSYTPIDRSVIFNASLLAGECLARFGAITENAGHLQLAAKTVRFVIRRQHGDGGWSYGANATQSWIDNFHTAYVLLSLYRISGDVDELRSETFETIGKGASFWLNNFFLDDGMPKYYNARAYPADIHSAAVAISTMCELKAIDAQMLPLARKVAGWTIENMLDPDGHFYYQKRKGSLVKTPFMRWGQAWMAYALARLIETEN
jgi:hypothetical protein